MPRFVATYTDGSTYEGGLIDGSFSGIEHDRLASFAVSYEGISVSLDLLSGVFTINGESQRPPIAPAPRLIAYATMRGEMGQFPSEFRHERLYAFVVGWQATVPIEGKWRNIKLGLRVIPSEGRWAITEAI